MRYSASPEAPVPLSADDSVVLDVFEVGLAKAFLMPSPILLTAAETRSPSAVTGLVERSPALPFTPGVPGTAIALLRTSGLVVSRSDSGGGVFDGSSVAAATAAGVSVVAGAVAAETFSTAGVAAGSERGSAVATVSGSSGSGVVG